MKSILITALFVIPALLRAEKAEIKMLISQERLQAAKASLNIKAKKDPEMRVCFFDTPDAALDASKMILRVRLEEKAGNTGVKEADSVVKLRGVDKAPAGFEEEKPEADWVGPDVRKDVKPSFSIKNTDLDEAIIRKVLDGTLDVKDVMSAKQQKFAKACLMAVENFPWAKLRRYGVIDVWKSKRQIGSFKDVTVELWQLTMEGKPPLELLEISIKTKETDPQPAAETAREFYEAAKTGGFGEPAGESKTQKVIQYYRPGK